MGSCMPGISLLAAVDLETGRPIWTVVYPSFTRRLPVVYPSFTRRLPVVYPQFTRRLPAVCPPFTRRLPAVHPPFLFSYHSNLNLLLLMIFSPGRLTQV